MFFFKSIFIERIFAPIDILHAKENILIFIFLIIFSNLIKKILSKLI
ncbi:hypothetical protein SAMN05443292_1037 [Halpernia frigidisoli]|uniref:Uncharacterized protein n=1 Tax=Halpernia frigidisoli TaxID=1125876 RepID=A0A1I3EEN1_9FLAO|nr:hypothetical protein SAMN05443292_1037 [Halpernia frigidisoli]